MVFKNIVLTLPATETPIKEVVGDDTKCQWLAIHENMELAAASNDHTPVKSVA